MKDPATKHHCYSGDKYKASRPLDYIYDPLFTFSGPKDYYKAAHESFQTSSEFSVQPIFDSMFSDMVRFPRATLVLRPSHQLPLNIDTSYKGRVRAISQEKTITAEVTGTDRYKYFRRPVTEAKDGSPTAPTTRFPLLGLENVASLGLLAPPTTAQKPPTRYAATQVRATQTDYRESEAQTIPWTPPFTCRGDSTPEVLYLDQLSWGDGLPPGRHEVDVVERLRRKRAWESHLPPLDSQENINTRFKLIAEMEKSDWQFREKEIEAVHKERMKKSEQLLEEHNMMNRSRLTYRMEFLEDDINKRKERKLQLIRHEKERALRKLCMREKGYDPKKYKMSILEENLRHTSELYAPMKRYGVSLRNRHETLAQKQFTIDDRDICYFEYTPSYRPLFDYNKASQPKRQTELCVRETRWTMQNLVQLHQDLQKLRAKTTNDTLYAQMEQRIKHSEHTSATRLSCSEVSLPDETLYQAAIVIQRVLHSRSMQALMAQKRDCWKELMGELKISRLGSATLMKEEKVIRARLAGVLDNLIGLNVGTTIGQTLYLLTSELLRFKNEGIAHSQALQAEAGRWRREMPEEGRRQRELRRREEHNLMFSQLLEVYQESINKFLEEVVAQARENEAKLQGYEHAKAVAWLAELERLKQAEPVPEEPVSADLLFELIAPEGLRELARTCMLVLKQKYQQARQCLIERGQAKSPTQENDWEPTEVIDKLSRGIMEQTTSHFGGEEISAVEQRTPSGQVSEQVIQSNSITSTGLELLVPASREPTSMWLYCVPATPSTSTGEEPSPSVTSSRRSMEKRGVWPSCPDSAHSTSTAEKLSVSASSGSLQVGITGQLESVSSAPSTSSVVESSTLTGSGTRHTEGMGPQELVASALSSINTGEPSVQASSRHSSYIQSKVTEMVSGLMTPVPQSQLQEAPAPDSAEGRLLARVMRDMCYMAGSLLHTAATILNKALLLAGIPQESFEEALRRTMLVINGALEEVIGLILPKKPGPTQAISEELILEASKIVDEILEKAKQRISEMKEKNLLKMEFDKESQAKAIVEDIIKEAQQKVMRMIVEDFLTDLFLEAVNKAESMTEN